MGNGKRLQEILADKKIKVRQLASRTGIAPTTLYSIIQRDGSIRLDYAVKIADVLNIEHTEICNDTSKLPELPLKPQSELNNIIDTLSPKELTVLDKLLTDFYSLDDNGREQILAMVTCMKKQQNKKEKPLKGQLEIADTDCNFKEI